ncbi:uncharacterized protein M8220_016294 [Acridotheres tristis]
MGIGPSLSEVGVGDNKVPVQWRLSRAEAHPMAEAAALGWAPAAAANSLQLERQTESYRCRSRVLYLPSSGRISPLGEKLPGLSCLAFLDEMRQYDSSEVLPGTSGNSIRNT